MPSHDLFPFMYLAYMAAGAVFLIATCAVLIWLCLANPWRGPLPRAALGQEFLWTLVTASVVIGLTVLGEIPRGWVRHTAVPQPAGIQGPLVR